MRSTNKQLHEAEYSASSMPGGRHSICSLASVARCSLYTCIVSVVQAEVEDDARVPQTFCKLQPRLLCFTAGGLTEVGRSNKRVMQSCRGRRIRASTHQGDIPHEGLAHVHMHGWQQTASAPSSEGNTQNGGSDVFKCSCRRWLRTWLPCYHALGTVSDAPALAEH